jgi:hypothetical protein
MKAAIMAEFEARDLGEASIFLGMEINAAMCHCRPIPGVKWLAHGRNAMLKQHKSLSVLKE